MLEAYIIAITTLFQPVRLLILFVAVIIGLIIGVIPTIGGLFIMPLLLPFIFHIPAELALILLVSLHSVIHTSGSIPAILFNIPGTPPNAATMLDGFPMNQRGDGSRAIGAAATSSMLGGIIPVFLALAMVPLAMPIVLAFGQPEMAFLVLLGISFLASLSRYSVTKGIISGMLGLLLSLVGYHAITGVHRFSFGTSFLYDGIELIPLTLGLFGLSELVRLVIRGDISIAPEAISTRWSGVFKGVKDVWRHKWLWFRSTVIGYVIGIIPGIGAEVASWVCYGQARQMSKNPHEFGSGTVEGVIAPEAANNAKEAGSLLTTMALGIPGSSAMAILLAAFLIVGITPGPAMMVEHLPLALTLLLGIALANIIGGILCLATAPYLVRVASINLVFLFPGIVIIALTGVYVATLSPINFITVLVFGILGLVMRFYDYSRPALLLGFVLGVSFEKYSMLSIKIYGPFFFLRPIPITIFIIIVMLLLYPLFRNKYSRFLMGVKRHTRGKSGLYVAIFFLLLGIFGLTQSLTFNYWESTALPLAVSSCIVILSSVEVGREFRRYSIEKDIRKKRAVENRNKAEGRLFLSIISWVAGFSVCIYLLGFYIAVPLFSSAYLRWKRKNWFVVIVFTLAILAFVYGIFEIGLKIPLFKGLLFGG